MFPLKYEGDIYRPPSEAKSLILQATVGCSHNRCTFCAMYKAKKYRERELEELKEEIDAAGRLWPQTRRVFLADGNALAMATEKLRAILQHLMATFPSLERVALYANPRDLLEKEVAELAELRRLKLGMIYLGVESGSRSVLQAVKKGATPEEIARGAARVKKAGIPLSVTVINGLAGLEGTEEHARESARLLNEIDPEYLGLLSLMIIPGTSLYREVMAGRFTPLGPWDMIKEIRLMVEQLSLSNCVFRANHASNYLPLKAILSRDRAPLLALLDELLKSKTEGILRSEHHRRL
ncbi:MAG: radical SAM protein [Firmicutes bacterium]|nr:radical SAM protein [Bacillota bacterium]HPU01911.1 radical SAM protein [Bacillota bacterium]